MGCGPIQDTNGVFNKYKLEWAVIGTRLNRNELESKRVIIIKIKCLLEL